MRYRCGQCSAEGVKLWRDYQPVNGVHLQCAPCAALADGRGFDVSGMDADGRWERPDNIGLTNQIGWNVPAVEDGEGNFWGVTSCPPEDFARWLALPSLP